MKKVNSQNSKRSTLGYIFGGLSFIPLLGVVFGIAAIINGILNRTKGPIFLGLGGILVTIALYGGLFYFGFIAKFGPYYELKKQFDRQLLNQTKGQILIYKEKYKKLPDKLEDMGENSPENFYMTIDAWMNPIIYKPYNDGTFEIRSRGPDGLTNTQDDIISR